MIGSTPAGAAVERRRAVRHAVEADHPVADSAGDGSQSRRSEEMVIVTPLPSSDVWLSAVNARFDQALVDTNR